ncbi:MAG: ABC transporter ATP-binding protein [Acidimicrobiia bacterium]|nr:ABC transporter ATP-binding protein [Acidimicrobiia bacterium]
MTAPTRRPTSIAPAVGAVRRLELTDVSVRYRQVTVLDRVSLTTAAGEWLAVIGPNGAGKSTLLKAIAGVVDHSGTVDFRLDGEPSVGSGRGAPPRAARLVAYVPQNPVLPPGMTTAEYVLMGRTSHLRWFQFESGRDRDLVGRTLADLDLADMAARPVAELSGGESQRVALARAIVQQASILVLDEPTSALDLAHQMAVLELVDELRERYGLIVITSMHDLTIASRHADQVLLLDHGRPAVQGRPSDVLTAEILSGHYGVEVSVLPDPNGGVIVVPIGHRSRTADKHRTVADPHLQPVIHLHHIEPSEGDPPS